MQALIITAYKSTEQLIRLIETAHKNFLLFIHVDKKTTSIDIDKIKRKNFSNVILTCKYNITWGGANHLLAILYMLKLAVSDSRITYIHIIYFRVKIFLYGIIAILNAFSRSRSKSI